MGRREGAGNGSRSNLTILGREGTVWSASVGNAWLQVVVTIFVGGAMM